MSLFRKQPPSEAPLPAPEPATSDPVPVKAPAKQALFDGATVHLAAVYSSAKLTAEELDRVSRAEGLLQSLPSKAKHTREIVDATFRAFGVARERIVEAANKQLEALEEFVRFSQQQTQGVLDVNAKRIAELEAEIERCRQDTSRASREGEERARSANAEMVKVQRVLDFFAEEVQSERKGGDLDESTAVHKSTAPVDPA